MSNSKHIWIYRMSLKDLYEIPEQILRTKYGNIAQFTIVQKLIVSNIYAIKFIIFIISPLNMYLNKNKICMKFRT